MTAADCIRGKAAAGTVSEADAEEAASLYDRMLAETGDPDRAAVEAAKTLRFTKQLRARQELLQMRAWGNAQNEITRVAPKDARKAALSLYEDGHIDMSPTSIAKTGAFVRNQAHALMDGAINRFRAQNAGIKRAGADTVGMETVARELRGEATGDAGAKELAAGIADALEFLRLEFNRAGGAIRKLKNWGLPQSHNRQKLAEVSEEEWVGFIRDRLDRTQMIDYETGIPLNDIELEGMLRGAYRNIVTDGMDDVRPGVEIMRTRRKIANTRQQHRHLIFRDSEAWIEYQREFGDDIYAGLMNHIDGMSHDIAAMRMLGPNPDSTTEAVKSLVERIGLEPALQGVGRKAARALRNSSIGVDSIDEAYRISTGRMNSVSNGRIMRSIQGSRNVLVAAKLGSAFLSAITDIGYTAANAAFNGLPATRIMAAGIKTFATASNADRRAAIRGGFGAESAAQALVVNNRYYGEVIGPEKTRRLSDIVLRASFLTPWTDSMKVANHVGLAGAVTEDAGKAFAELSAARKRMLSRYRIGAAEWNEIRTTSVWTDPETGATFIRPQDIITQDRLGVEGRDFTRDVANRYSTMILTEADFGVPTVSGRTRRALLAGQRPGTIGGEIVASTLQFKSFPVNLTMITLERMIRDTGSPYSKWKWAASMVVAGTVLGALSEQLRQIAAGRDPFDMTTGKFWGQAALRGGGLGIYGDFLFTDVNRYGSTLGSLATGPLASAVIKPGVQLTLGNLQELATEGEAKHAGREMQRFVEGLMPGRNLWYGRLVLDRMVFDNLAKAIDPEYADRFRRIERRARKEYGQGYFSRPGRGVIPQRAPDLEAALGGR